MVVIAIVVIIVAVGVSSGSSSRRQSVRRESVGSEVECTGKGVRHEGDS